jgi:hypothetical protein
VTERERAAQILGDRDLARFAADIERLLRPEQTPQ